MTQPLGDRSDFGQFSRCDFDNEVVRLIGRECESSSVNTQESDRRRQCETLVPVNKTVVSRERLQQQRRRLVHK